MREVLLKYTKDFTTSKPVFTLKVTNSEISINRAPLNKFKPTPIEGDTLSRLVCSCFSEDFSTGMGGFVISRDDIVKSAIFKVNREMLSFVERYSPLRNPRQGKLHKFMRKGLYDSRGDDLQDSIIMLYKYMVEKTVPESIPEVEKKQHVKNILVLLENLMEKYSEESK
jgi:hypothetical protein